MVNGKQLQATVVVWQMVWMRDSFGSKQSHAIYFIIDTISHYDVILSMAWLQKQNPDIHWETGVWHQRTHTEAEDGPICLVSAGLFVTTIHAERTHGYELHLHELGLHPDHNTARDALMATGPEPTVP
jgi:hypothetical protein